MARRPKRKVTASEIVIRTTDGVPICRIPPLLRQEMQYLWTRLEVHDGNVPRSVGLTSQLSGEGVSFTSRALAAVLARHGATCLVEANWWGEGLPLETTNDGLAGILQGSSDIDDVLVPTSHPGLSILPSGDLNVSGGSIVSSVDSMAPVLEVLHRRFTHAILDLPAISTSATALSFAAAADASLLVVRQRVTHVDQVEGAVHDLRHTRLLGVVLNDNHLSMPNFLQRRLVPQT